MISGRIGVTDAELMVKKFQPTFDLDDLTKLPNFQSITSVMINNVPSAPFSMDWIPAMGQMNKQLRDALVKLSSAKYGRPRADVEREIFARLGQKKLTPGAATATGTLPATTGNSPKAKGSFLDEWLAKRQQLNGAPLQPAKASMMTGPAKVAAPAPTFATKQPGELMGIDTSTSTSNVATVAPPGPLLPPAQASSPPSAVVPQAVADVPKSPELPAPPRESLNLRGDIAPDEEIQINFR